MVASFSALIDAQGAADISAPVYAVLICATLFGSTMKIADLLDEHGLKGFRSSDIVFGLLWGTFGVLLTLDSVSIANALAAMIIGFIVRYRIDYLNHGIAAASVLIAFLAASRFERWTFFPLFAVFAGFGILEDYLSEKFTGSSKLTRIPFYSMGGIAYAAASGNWLVCFVLTCYEWSYILTDLIAKRMRHGSIDFSSAETD